MPVWRRPAFADHRGEGSQALAKGSATGGKGAGSGPEVADGRLYFRGGGRWPDQAREGDEAQAAGEEDEERRMREVKVIFRVWKIN
jgi:hypothetical protein